MKSMAAVLIGLACVCARAADAPKPEALPAPAAVARSEADDLWMEVQSSGALEKMQATGDKAPTPAEVDAHKKRVALRLLRDADKAKEFYTRFPNHAKADAAREKEKKLREDAATFGPVDSKQDKPGRDPVFEAKLREALSQAEAVQALGSGAVARQYEELGRKLGKEYPNREEPFMLMEMATRATQPGKVLALLREIVASAPPGQFRDQMTAELAARDVVNKAINVSGPNVKGETINLAQYKGKVVLLDFWATWCPACVSLTPGLLQVYEKYHSKGFEIIGINLDDDAADLKQYVERHHVPWPQIADASMNGAALARQFRARGIPMLYMIDKTGKVRDVDPLGHFIEELEMLLAQP